MNTPSPDADDPDKNPGSYGFSEPAPPKREGPPTKYDKYATREPEPEDEPADDDEPRPKKQKKRRDLAYEPPPDPDEDPLTRPKPWWFWTVVLAVAGFVGIVVTAITAGVSVGFKAGVIALVGAVFGVAVETVVVAALMVLIGVVFGIDYGPVNQAIVKLFGCVAFVNGFTLGFGMLCYSCIGPLGILAAIASITLVSFAVFQSQFKLSMYEALVTVLTIQGSAWLMATGLGFAFMRVK